MPSTKDIEKQLDGIQSWILISNKKNVLKGLGKLIAEEEAVVDLMEGLYRGIKISVDRDLAGVLCATSRRLLFVTSELSAPQYEEIPFEDIRGIAYERAFSSIIMTLKLRSSTVTFKTFDNKTAVNQFIELINRSDGSVPVTREDNTLKILNEVNETMKTISEMSNKIGTGMESSATFYSGGLALDIDSKNLDLLFQEAKKITRNFSELLSQTGSGELKSSITHDLIILISLCKISKKTMSDGEILFTSLVLMPLNSDDTPGARKISDEIFSGDTFQYRHRGAVLEHWENISSHIKKFNPDIDLAGYSLKTMNLIENIDREKGTKNADRAGSLLYTFAQCLMKADGTMDAGEEERLKQIYRLINRGSAVSSTAVAVKEAEEQETLEEVMKKINALIGMDKIKEQIATLVNLIKVQKEREERKLPATQFSLHAVFYGPPGTGKTTIARLLGRVYRALGLLKKGQLVETDRAGLVAGYVGQTAINVDAVVQKAMDGVLFIDEAYALIPDDIGGRDFGQEAVNTILKRMEDNRDRLVVIVAGYTEEMDRFIQSNPGLKSRFSRYFYFDHYKPEELFRIFESFCSNVEFTIEAPARDRVLSLLGTLYEKRDRTFGNGRLARNIFERVVERQANRIAGISPLTDSILCTITADDIPEAKDII